MSSSHLYTALPILLLAGCTHLESFKDWDQDGFSVDQGDCDDGDPDVNPGEVERANGIDDDCDGLLDEHTAGEVHDQDGDGYTASQWGGNDCDDLDFDVNPGREEVCNDGIDNDCDGERGACLLQGVVSLTQADAQLVGANAYLAGSSLAVIPDMDRDGTDEVAVGAAGCSEGRGAALVVHGPVSGVADLLQPDATLLGEQPGDYLGLGMDAGPDLDGDGLADLVLGAPYHSSGANDGGAVYIVSAAFTGAATVTDTAIRLLGVNAREQAGLVVCSGGDLSGDGLPDLVVGAPSLDTTSASPSAAYVVLGPITSSGELQSLGLHIQASAAGTMAGASLAVVGDVDGDGFSDLFIGAERESVDTLNEAGRAVLLLGPLQAELNLATDGCSFHGVEDGQRVGSAVAGPGDLNGDGYADLVVGARGWDAGAADTGGAYVLLGSHRPTSSPVDEAAGWILGVQDGDRAGESLGSAGDMDQDGRQDLLLGSNIITAEEGQGVAWLIYGPATGTVALASDTVATFVPSLPDSGAGATVAGGGDLDGDGYPDLLVGAPEDAVYGEAAGRVFMVRGLGL